MLFFTVVTKWPKYYAQARCLNTAARQHDQPLRILFCGSDDFSVASLRALHNYSKESNSNIISIDVATKKDKLSGRGLKKVKAPPIKSVAKELALPLHQFDTFTGWAPPSFDSSQLPAINLIIAVSFGLLIPARVINGAMFGGLNVHPSLLPDLRGAAPLNWAIIHGYTQTGVSVQTLHPTRFDEGIVLAQTQPFRISNDACVNELRNIASPIGAELLIQTLRQKLYLQPHVSVAKIGDTELSMAPKIVSDHKLLDPSVDDLETILRKNRAIPKLFAYARAFSYKSGMENVRVIFGTDMREATASKVPHDAISKMQPGIPFALTDVGLDPATEPNPIYVICKDRKVLELPLLLVEGRREMAASRAAAGSGLLEKPFDVGKHSIHPFRGLFNRS